MAITAKCAVVGAGVIGAAAASALAGRGADVALFDQFALHHDRGSSHGPTRLFRTAYFEHPDYVPLLKRSAAQWRALEENARKTLIHWSGVLVAGAADSALLSGTVETARLHDLSLRQLAPREMKTQAAGLAIPSDFEVVFEADAGVIFADRAHVALLNSARDNGAALVEGEKILGWKSISDSVAVRLSSEERHFDRIVLAPGAWAESLLGDIGASVRPIQKALYWIAAGERAFHLDSGFPPFAIEQRDGRFFYGFPAIDDEGVKVGEHTGGKALNSPDEYRAEPADDPDALRAFLGEFAPGLPGTITQEKTCLYAMSPDGNFLIDRHPQDARVVFAAGLSGHGFKFAPVIGDALADLALKGETAREFDFLKLARFSRTD